MEAIVEQLGNLTVLEVLDLVKKLETKWGVSAKPVVVHPAGYKTETPIEEAKTIFDVELVSVGANKIAVIKLVREITKEGLMEAKQRVENSPVKIAEGVSDAEANAIKEKLEAIGAQIEVK